MIANDPLWEMICTEALQTAAKEPLMSGFFDAAILSHQNLAQALCFNLSQQLHSQLLKNLNECLSKCKRSIFS